MSHRWKALGLNEPRNLDLPDHPTTADLAMYALRARGCEDPVEGILRGVESDLGVLADATDSGAPFVALARRVEVAIKLLRRADGREKAPTVRSEEDDKDPPSTAPGGARCSRSS